VIGLFFLDFGMSGGHLDRHWLDARSSHTPFWCIMVL
jgi:hypothetical protein